MDPATIGLAIAGTRALVKSARGIKDISQGLDDLFKAQEDQANSKKKGQPKTRTQQIVNMRAKEGDEAFDDETSMGTVVSDVLEQKQLEMNMKALEKEIDAKWGRGTWKDIIAERETRVEKKKHAKEARKRKAEEDKEFWHKVLIETGKACVLIISLGALAGFLYWAFQHGGK